MSNVEITERTRFCPQTDRRTDGQTDGRTRWYQYTPLSTSLKRGYNNEQEQLKQNENEDWTFRGIFAFSSSPLLWCAMGTSGIIDILGYACYRVEAWKQASRVYTQLQDGGARSHYAPGHTICVNASCVELFWLNNKHMGQVTKVWLSCYLVLLSNDSKTR